MVLNLTRPVAVSAVLLVASCSFVDEKLLPPLTGDPAPVKAGQEAAATAEKSAMTSDPTATQATLAAGSTATTPPTAQATPSRFQLPEVTTAPSTGTVVGQRVETLRDNLRALQARINQGSAQFEAIEASTSATSQRYHGTMAAINARLQIGTTKGNPILINQWNEAQSDLEKIAADVSEMNSLANTVAGDAGEVGFLLESVQSAFELSGAIEEDHRQLTVLEDETSRTSVLANRLLNQLTNDINRQTAYVGTERMNLTNTSIAIKNGGFLGTSAGTRNYLETASADTASEERQALVIIRFDNDDVAYEQALYDAVSRTMQERPQSYFDVVSVAPLNGNLAGNQAKSIQNAERVLRSLVEMGLPASRVKLASTANASVASSEVHVYVR
jgi:phage gpG-like protein